VDPLSTSSRVSRLELRDFELFVGVAEAGGFRRGAIRLRVKQSVISRRIQKLEDLLGVSLFERWPGGSRLTNAGELLLAEARLIIAKVGSTVRSLGANGSAAEGLLRIGVGASVSTGFMRELLRSWVAEHPHVALELVEAEPREHLAGIADRRFDVTFVSGLLDRDPFDVEKLWDEPVCAALPSAHPLVS